MKGMRDSEVSRKTYLPREKVEVIGPAASHARNDLAPGFRSYALGRSVIFYRLESEAVLIAHVLHGSQDLDSYPFDIS